MKKLLVKGNSKMGRLVYLFNLPAQSTCTPTHWCLHGRNGKPACYALRGNHTWARVKQSQADRLQASRGADFVPRVVDELHAAGCRWFRLHSSGDFYSADYVAKWRAIAAVCPDVILRTSTRRRDLAGPIRELAALPNVVIRESLDDDRPEPVMGLPYATIDTIPAADRPGVLRCSDHCPSCQYGCWRDGACHVAFEVH